MKRGAIILTLLAFGALSVVALAEHGFSGIFRHQLLNTGGMQVLADLAIALVLCLYWMWKDARARGRNPLPWVGLTLVAGSFGPLIYLLTRKD